jgi:hypothetical protein
MLKYYPEVLVGPFRRIGSEMSRHTFKLALGLGMIAILCFVEAAPAIAVPVDYVAVVHQQTAEGTGTFVSSFHTNLAAAYTTLNEASQLQAWFSGSGSIQPAPGGGTNWLFTNFDLKVWAADDVLVGVARNLVAGEVWLSPGLTSGRFDVLARFEPAGGFLSGAVTMQLNGVDFTTSLTMPTMPLSNSVENLVYDNGTVGYGVVPEPATLLLLGSGLAGLGLLYRRSR